MTIFIPNSIPVKCTVEIVINNAGKFLNFGDFLVLFQIWTTRMEIQGSQLFEKMDDQYKLLRKALKGVGEITVKSWADVVWKFWIHLEIGDAMRKNELFCHFKHQ